MAIRKKAPKKAVKKAVKKAPKKAANKVAAKVFAADLEDTDREVKQLIIANSPLSDIGPNDLTDDMTLSGNLNYTATNKSMLTIDLDKFVNDRKSSAHVKASDMTNVKTVGDVIKLVKTKLK